MKKIFFFTFLSFVAALCFFWPRGQFYDSASCPFCNTEILNRKKLYEDDLCYVLYSHRPIEEGHCLVIPKRHVERFEALSNEESLRLCELVRKVHKTVSEKLGGDSYLLLQKNGSEVGQTVPHVHIHYLPRDNDSFLGFLMKMWMVNTFRPISNEEMERKMTLFQISK